jgi:hypothetical protein
MRKKGIIRAFAEGAPHVVTEGIPGLYYYAAGRLKGNDSTANRVDNELAPEVKSEIDKVAALEALAVKGNASSFDDLTCNQQSVLFSTMYHEGSIGKANSAPFVNALLEGDDDAAQAALKAKSESSNKLLAQRGKAELAFYTGGS